MIPDLTRIGVLVPPGNCTCEAEFPRYLPEGFAVNFNRLSRPGGRLTTESLLAMIVSLERAAKDMAMVEPKVILYACTSGTFLSGPAKHGELGEKIRAATGVPGITTSTAVLEALRALSAGRVFMATPYPKDINEHEIEFLEYHGIQVPKHDSFLYQESRDIRVTPSAKTAELVLKHKSFIKGMDAVFISCTNLRTMDQIERLERELGVPVISSNSATLWAGLREAGAETRGLRAGRLYGLDLTHAFLKKVA